MSYRSPFCAEVLILRVCAALLAIAALACLGCSLWAPGLARGIVALGGAAAGLMLALSHAVWLETTR